MGRVITEHGFDSVLYVDINKKGVVQSILPDATYRQGQICITNVILTYCYSMPSWYSVGKNGEIIESSLVLIAKSELHDVHFDRDVWTAETSISAQGSDLSGLPKLFQDLAKQITTKLQTEGVIARKD